MNNVDDCAVSRWQVTASNFKESQCPMNLNVRASLSAGDIDILKEVSFFVKSPSTIASNFLNVSGHILMYILKNSVSSLSISSTRFLPLRVTRQGANPPASSATSFR